MMEDLRLIDHADSRCYVIAEGACHGQTWDILLFDPDSEWPHLLAVFIAVGENSATVHLYTHGLAFVLSFVVG